jgi:branched-chain amino acid transport system ATP-binding protein
MPEPILALHGIDTHLGRYHILHGVSFTVPEGSVSVLLGRNGAGKTTTLRTIMGLAPASRGEVLFRNRPLGALSTARRARLGLVYVPENTGVFGSLSVAENLRLAAPRGRAGRALLEGLKARFPLLAEHWHQAARTLSGGERQILALARALLMPAELYLIDEPSKGLAPVMVAKLRDVLGAFRGAHKSVLLVEQNLALAAALGEHAVVLEDGRTVYEGPLAAFLADPKACARHLGIERPESAPP